MNYDKAMEIILHYDTYTLEEVQLASEYILSKKDVSFADSFAARNAVANYSK